MRRIFIAIVLTVALELIGAGFIVWHYAGDDSTDHTIRTAGDSLDAVIVLPDDGEAPFIEEIESATESLRVYVYLLSDEATIEALERSERRGIEVRVILEHDPYGGAGTEEEVFRRLSSAGIDVRWAGPDFRFAHIKTIVADDNVALIMSLNLTESALSHNREFAVLTTDPSAVQQATEIFDADWNQEPYSSTGPLIVSPDTSRETILGLIDSAEQSIDMFAEVITDDEVAQALSTAVGRGVTVRLVMSEAFPGELLFELPGVLAQTGVEVRILNSPYIHAKALIIDGEMVFIGSQNYTSTSLDHNRELGIVVADSFGVDRVANAFDRDFESGIDLLKIDASTKIHRFAATS